MRHGHACWVLGFTLTVWSCSGSDDATPDDGAGGSAATGGAGNGGADPTGGGNSPAEGGSSATTGGSTHGSGGATGGVAATTGGQAGVTATGGTPASGGTVASGGAVASGGTSTASGGASALTGGAAGTGGTSTHSGGNVAEAGSAGEGPSGSAALPFPQNVRSEHCVYPKDADPEKARAAYRAWYDATVTADGAGGFLRIKKPDSGSVIGSTVSEGIGYGMILAVMMGDQNLFDNLWKYEQSHRNDHGLMDWEIGPDNQITSGGHGAASDGDEDMAWALVMADRQWGGSGSLDDTYLNHAKALIELILEYEVDAARGYMLKPGDEWGNVDVTNPSYFAPAYYRVFGPVTGKVDEWNQVIAGNYDILERSLNATSGNQDNGLVPAWCNSAGEPVEAFSGAPTYFQNDSTRTPFRVGQDYCTFGEPRAKAYLAKISSFYAGIGASAIVDGYELDGTPRPDRAVDGAQAASFVGPAGVGAMSDASYQTLLDDAYAAVATLELDAGTIYYQKSWTALALLMLTGNLVDFTQL
jgi:endo-1,4-beta-D-glucanase Y